MAADCERGDGEHHDVLPALAGSEDEEAVLAVGRDAGHEHQGDDPGGGGRRHEADRQEEAGTDLGGRRHAGVEPPRLHAHAGEPCPGTGQLPATEHLVEAVEADGQPDAQTQDEEAEVGVVHTFRLAEILPAAHATNQTPGRGGGSVGTNGAPVSTIVSDPLPLRASALRRRRGHVAGRDRAAPPAVRHRGVRGGGLRAGDTGVGVGGEVGDRQRHRASLRRGLGVDRSRRRGLRRHRRHRPGASGGRHRAPLVGRHHPVARAGHAAPPSRRAVPGAAAVLVPAAPHRRARRPCRCRHRGGHRGAGATAVLDWRRPDGGRGHDRPVPDRLGAGPHRVRAVPCAGDPERVLRAAGRRAGRRGPGADRRRHLVRPREHRRRAGREGTRRRGPRGHAPRAEGGRAARRQGPRGPAAGHVRGAPRRDPRARQRRARRGSGPTGCRPAPPPSATSPASCTCSRCSCGHCG